MRKHLCPLKVLLPQLFIVAQLFETFTSKQNGPCVATPHLSRWMCTTVQWVPPRHRNVLWGLSCGQLEGKMGNWRHKLHPCGKTDPSSSVGGLKGYGGAAHRFFFCVNTNWCHLETVKKIKQLYRSSWATNKIWWTKGRFVFLPSTIPPIQTREKKKLRTISRVVERQ